MTQDQIESILASIEFSEKIPTSHELFEKGKADLAQSNYLQAILHILSAYYYDHSDTDKLEYAYYLALAFYEDRNRVVTAFKVLDKDVDYKAVRLAQASGILKALLEVKPDHTEAKALLDKINAEVGVGQNSALEQ